MRAPGHDGSLQQTQHRHSVRWRSACSTSAAARQVMTSGRGRSRHGESPLAYPRGCLGSGASSLTEHDAIHDCCATRCRRCSASAAVCSRGAST
jgi:hypothetical protein